VDIFCILTRVNGTAEMPPTIHTFSDEINYLIWRYLRETSCVSPSPYLVAARLTPPRVDLTQSAWTLEAEIRSKSGKDVLSVHEQVGKNISFDLPKRLRMSMQYQEVLKHMSDVLPQGTVVESRTVIYLALLHSPYYLSIRAIRVRTQGSPYKMLLNGPGS